MRIYKITNCLFLFISIAFVGCNHDMEGTEGLPELNDQSEIRNLLKSDSILVDAALQKERDYMAGLSSMIEDIEFVKNEVNVDALVDVVYGEGDSTFVLINDLGNPVLTGTAIPFIGESEICLMSTLKKAEDRDASEFHGLGETIVEGDYYYDGAGGMILDQNGFFWIGGTELTKYDGVYYQDYLRPGKDMNNTENLLIDSDENVWFTSTPDRRRFVLTKFDGKEFIHYSSSSDLYIDGVRSIYEDSSGIIWVAMYYGVVLKIQGDSCTYITQKEGIDSHSVQDIVEGENGEMWFSTGKGVVKFDGETFTKYYKESGLISNSLLNSYKDLDGNIWFGTWDGVSVFNGSSFISINEETGLLGSFVHDITGRCNGDVIVATSSGVNIFRLDEGLKLNLKNEFIYEDLIFLFPGTETVTCDEYDNIWISKIGQINRLPRRVSADGGANNNDYDNESLLPSPLLNSISINGEFYDFHNFNISENPEILFDSVVPFHNYPINLKLPYDCNNITFNYSAIEWKTPHKIKYAYKLEGLNHKWSAVTTDTKVDYHSLNAGTYTFKLAAIGESLKWSEPFEYTFKIQPAAWFTTTAKLMYFFGLILLMWGIVKIRTLRLVKRKKELEREVKAATEQIKEQKAEVEKQRDLALNEHKIAEEQRGIAETQKNIVLEKNREILDSISYAKKLQNAILPPPRLVKEWLNDSFIYYKPKAIVSGDFYWMEVTKKDGRNIIFYAVADCTGHGVPGAMVSVVCSTALNRAVKEFNINDPAMLLDKVSELVNETFAQSENSIKDGMDIAICAIDLLAKKIWFAGANNPLYRITDTNTKIANDIEVVEKGERMLIEYKADKQPIGDFDSVRPFTTTEIQLEPGDCIYVFSDGFTDQLGGDQGKKYKSSNFKEFLMQIETKEMDAQKEILDTEIERWKGEFEQVDDICIIGLRINGKMGKIFTKRELEVIKKISEGKPSKIIADELVISKNTVDTHRKRIMAKTNAHNGTELINFCKLHHII